MRSFSLNKIVLPAFLAGIIFLPTPTNACTTNLSLGSEGSGVHCLQQMLTLTRDYTYGEITGYFGPVTQAAIQKFQARLGIVSQGTPATTGYGNAGPITRLTLLQEALKVLQTQLALLLGTTPPTAAITDSGGVSGGGEKEITSPKSVSCTDKPTLYEVGSPSSNDTQNIQNTVNQAISDIQTGKVGRAEIRLKRNATYHLKARSDRYDALDFRTQDLTNPNISCLDFNGNGATLAIDPYASGLYIGHCTNCTFKNFTLKTDDDVGTQGVVTNVYVPTNNSDAGYVDIKVQSGHPLFSIPDGYESERVVRSASLLHAIFHGFTPNTQPHHLSFDYGKHGSLTMPAHLAINYATKNSGGGTMRVFFNSKNNGGSDWTEGLLQQIVPDQTVLEVPQAFTDLTRRESLRVKGNQWGATVNTTPAYFGYSTEFGVGSTGAGIYFDASSDLRLEDITITEFLGTGVLAMNNHGPVVIDGLNIAPDKSSSLHSGGSVGLRAGNNRQGFVIKNSHFENLDDDSIDFVTIPYYATDISSDRKVVTLTSYVRPVAIYRGDTFLIYDRNAGSQVGSTYTVNEVVMTGRLSYRVTLSQPLPSSVRTIANEPHAFINEFATNAGGEISDNLFLNSLRNGVVTRSGVKITGNSFINLGRSAILYTHGLDWQGLPPRGEWGDTKRLDVSNNVFVDNNEVLNLGVGLRTGSVTTAGISFRNNTIVGPRNWVVNRVSEEFKTPVSASGNTVYTSLNETNGELVKDNQWTTDFVIETLSEDQLQAKRDSVSSVNTQSLNFAADTFGINVTAGGTYTFSSDFSSGQGAQNWFYNYKSGTSYLAMAWDAAKALWQGGSAIIYQDRFTPGLAIDAVATWQAPLSGTVHISGLAKDANTLCGDGAVVSIYKDSSLLWQRDIANGDTTGQSHSLNTSVTSGDHLHFVVNNGGAGDNSCDGTAWNPTITYQ